MRRRVLTIPQWEKWLKDYGKRAVAAMKIGMAAGGQRAVMALQRRTDELKAVDTATYKRDWKMEKLENGVRIFNQAPYAAVIEWGRRVGATPPPASALVPWVKRKLGVADDKARSAAFLVAQAIQRNGIKGKYILTNLNPTISKWIQEEMIDALKRMES